MNNKTSFISNARPALATTVLVGSVAALFGCASSNAPAKAPSGIAAAMVRCQGINECKGKGTCAGNGHPCGRHTPCKGQGWLSVTPEECSAKGGTVL